MFQYMKSKLLSITKPVNLALGAFLLPYVTIILITIIVRLLPYDTVDQKWESAGGIILWLPYSAVILSAILIGVDTVRLNKEKSSTFRLTLIFVSTVLLTTGVQILLALGFFMQMLYIYAGAKH